MPTPSSAIRMSMRSSVSTMETSTVVAPACLTTLCQRFLDDPVERVLDDGGEPERAASALVGKVDVHPDVEVADRAESLDEMFERGLHAGLVEDRWSQVGDQLPKRGDAERDLLDRLIEDPLDLGVIVASRARWTRIIFRLARSWSVSSCSSRAQRRRSASEASMPRRARSSATLRPVATAVAPLLANASRMRASSARELIGA